jgi:DNA-3-methyladenine glycosylase
MKANLPLTYFQQKDVVSLAKDLLGKSLHTKINGVHTAGIITETEAYNGIYDKACHAFGNRRTKRTGSMYLIGGCAYVYLCYGIHSLFNIVSGPENNPTAILIRSIEPTIGIGVMLKRRRRHKLDQSLCSGPGNLTKALGIGLHHDTIELNGPEIYLEEYIKANELNAIETTSRIGVDYAGKDAKLPYRFILKK